MLECTDNGRGDTVLSCFRGAVNEFGLPNRVCIDNGLENVDMAEFMIQNRRSVIDGKSTHNQRIEHLSRDVYEGVLSFFLSSLLFYGRTEHTGPTK